MAWCLQGLASNEFTSSKYDVDTNGVNVGDVFLTVRGFQTGSAWIGYAFVYMIPFMLVCTGILGIILSRVLIEPERFHVNERKKISIGEYTEGDEGGDFNLPFTPVELSFDKLVYEVKASTSGDTLRLLNEVSGVFKPGRMCALMG
jgi:hypothetical protein